MTPNEFKAIRRALGLSVKRTASLLGVASERTVRRWEQGDREIPGPAIVLMRLLQNGSVSVDDITNLEPRHPRT